jgi:hypothetical protein
VGPAMTLEQFAGEASFAAYEDGAVTARCGRSEDGVQRLAFDRAFVRISRRIAGLETLVNVPTPSFRGVALQSLPAGGFRVIMRHADPGLDVVLAEAPDDADVIAEWRRYGRLTGLALLVEDREGRVRTLEAAGEPAPAPRRYGSSLKARRPRFLATRTVGVEAAATA